MLLTAFYSILFSCNHCWMTHQGGFAVLVLRWRFLKDLFIDSLKLTQHASKCGTIYCKPETAHCDSPLAFQTHWLWRWWCNLHFENLFHYWHFNITKLKAVKYFTLTNMHSQFKWFVVLMCSLNPGKHIGTLSNSGFFPFQRKKGMLDLGLKLRTFWSKASDQKSDTLPAE